MTIEQTMPALSEAGAAGGRSLGREALRRLFRNRAAVAGLTIILALALLAVFAPLVSPFDYQRQDLLAIYQVPSRAHLLGTDALGVTFSAV